MVTAAEVWSALADLPDPELPVLSLVDLGVVRDVTVTGSSVRVDITPTFLGCPALDVMRDRTAEAVRALGGEPDVRVVLDDSWTTDRITPAGRRQAPGGGAGASGTALGGRAAARPASQPHLPLPLLRVGGHVARERVRAHPVPVDPLLQPVPAAVRADQDRVSRARPGRPRPSNRAA